MLAFAAMGRATGTAKRSAGAGQGQSGSAGGPGTGRAFINESEALEWLRDRVNVEQMRPSRLDRDSVFKLDRMYALLKALGDPHQAFKSVHVAGTKGKGSVCEMTAACLQGCDYAVGLYTSPHLMNIRERIRLNGREIGGDEFIGLLGRVAGAVESLPGSVGIPTHFEIMTAAAMLHFAEQAVDFAVIETGLGGRLDATNVLTPEVAAITAIQLEHREILGDTAELIAAEKAGIFKPGAAALTVPQSASVLEVLRGKAAEIGVELRVLQQDIDFSSRFEASTALGPHTRVSVTTRLSEYEHLPVPLWGEHQAVNCGLALAIIDALRARGFEAPELKVGAGLAKTPSNGRLEQVWDRPRIYIDGAHNPESMHALVKSVGAHVRYDSMVVVFGCATDKDVAPMLAKIALGADKIIFTRAERNMRAMDPRELVRRFAEVSPKMAQAVPALKDAINTAASATGRDDIILVTGSFSLAGEAKRLLLQKRRAMEAGDPGMREIKPAAKRRARR